MNRVFKLWLDKFVVLFIDDILVFSKTDEEHEQHQLYATFFKCEFLLTSVAFLGHVISNKGISVDLKRVEAVQEWPRPTCVIEIRRRGYLFFMVTLFNYHYPS